MIGGGIFAGGTGAGIGATIAAYLAPGPPTVFGIALIFIFGIGGSVGGILMAMVQFCGR